jgi:hypothetical protein
LASRVTNEDEEEVLEEYEQMHREALGLPEVPIQDLPKVPERVPRIDETEPLPEGMEEERQAILA